jgi:predicted RNA-binding Zn-ribbon protein involved in translation (DUF1610 family)
MISVFALWFSVSNAQESKRKNKTAIVSIVDTTANNRSLSKTEIIARLKLLATSEPPKDLSLGAMCYEMIALPRRAEYTCPVCGEKTLYALPENKTNDWDNQLYKVIGSVNTEIPTCRQIIRSIKDLRLQLDETQFCRHCSSDVKDPVLVLKVWYDDPKNAYIVTDITHDDCRMLQEFIEGKKKHEFGNGQEMTLKDQLKRLEVLLGVSIDTDKH